MLIAEQPTRTSVVVVNISSSFPEGLYVFEVGTSCAAADVASMQSESNTVLGDIILHRITMPNASQVIEIPLIDLDNLHFDNHSIVVLHVSSLSTSLQTTSPTVNFCFQLGSPRASKTQLWFSAANKYLSKWTKKESKFDYYVVDSLYAV